MDLFSREAIGFAASETMITEQTTLVAFKMALEYRRIKQQDKLVDLIFHSDGGGQYSDKGFLAQLKKFGIKSSMAKNAYENPNAERLNGIIKNEYLLPWGVNSMAQLILKVPVAIKNYNNLRPHFALRFLTPAAFKEKHCLL